MPMRVAVVAPRVVAPIIVSTIVTVMASAHDDYRGGSDHDGRRDAEAHGDDVGAGRLRVREQGEPQERDHTPHAEDRCEMLHCDILTVEHWLYALTCRVLAKRLPHVH